MATYIFLPIPTGEFLGMAAQFNTARAAVNKPACTVLKNPVAEGFEKCLHHNQFIHGVPEWAQLRWPGRGALSGLTANDKLYVIAHGIASRHDPTGYDGVEIVGGRRPKHAKTFTPKALAVVLWKEGLCKDFVELHAWMCNSGLDTQSGGDPFAKRLAAELRALRYNSIKVYGYRGTISIDPVNSYQDPVTTATKPVRRVVTNRDDWKFYRASTMRVQF